MRIEQPTLLKSGDRFAIGAVHFKFLQERDVENAYFQAIHDMMVRDGLTQISNKRKFDDEAVREVARARRYARPLCLLLFDVDRFKSINDGRGHLCGDFVLKEVVRLVSDFFRKEQVFARVGGDEFAVLTPEARLDGAKTLGERLRSRVANHELRLRRRFLSRDVLVRDRRALAGDEVARGALRGRRPSPLRRQARGSRPRRSLRETRDSLGG